MFFLSAVTLIWHRLVGPTSELQPLAQTTVVKYTETTITNNFVFCNNMGDNLSLTCHLRISPAPGVADTYSNACPGSRPGNGHADGDATGAAHGPGDPCLGLLAIPNARRWGGHPHGLSAGATRPLGGLGINLRSNLGLQIKKQEIKRALCLKLVVA